MQYHLNHGVLLRSRNATFYFTVIWKFNQTESNLFPFHLFFSRTECRNHTVLILSLVFILCVKKRIGWSEGQVAGHWQVFSWVFPCFLSSAKTLLASTAAIEGWRQLYESVYKIVFALWVFYQVSHVLETCLYNVLGCALFFNIVQLWKRL